MIRLSGLIAASLFGMSLLYSIFKRLKIKKFNILKYHYYFSILGAAFVIIHVSEKLNKFSFTFGYLCFISIILLMTTGMLMRFLKGISSNIRKTIRCLHIFFSMVFIITLVFHVIEYLM